jgi:hypothetical protein
VFFLAVNGVRKGSDQLFVSFVKKDKSAIVLDCEKIKTFTGLQTVEGRVGLILRLEFGLNRGLKSSGIWN